MGSKKVEQQNKVDELLNYFFARYNNSVNMLRRDTKKSILLVGEATAKSNYEYELNTINSEYLEIWRLTLDYIKQHYSKAKFDKNRFNNNTKWF